MTDAAPPPGGGDDPAAVLDTDGEQLAIPLLTLARELLELNGCLYPFGGILPAAGGEVEVIVPPTDIPYPLVESVFHDVVARLREAVDSGRAAAVATCADVIVHLPDGTESTDAVRVSVERPGRNGRAYHLPYHREGVALHFDDLVVSPADPLVLAG